ncbi:Nn.00g046630.m01.CDS01 [Neocucurbitaria sp. VM-36]
MPLAARCGVLAGAGTQSDDCPEGAGVGAGAGAGAGASRCKRWRLRAALADMYSRGRMAGRRRLLVWMGHVGKQDEAVSLQSGARWRRWMNSMRPRCSSTPASIYLSEPCCHRAQLAWTDFASMTVTNMWPNSAEESIATQINPASFQPTEDTADARALPSIAARRIGREKHFSPSQTRVALLRRWSVALGEGSGYEFAVAQQARRALPRP